MQATRHRARACIFHKTLGLMLYLLHTHAHYWKGNSKRAIELTIIVLKLDNLNITLKDSENRLNIRNP